MRVSTTTALWPMAIAIAVVGCDPKPPNQSSQPAEAPTEAQVDAGGSAESGAVAEHTTPVLPSADSSAEQTDVVASGDSETGETSAPAPTSVPDPVTEPSPAPVAAAKPEPLPPPLFSTTGAKCGGAAGVGQKAKSF